MKKLILVIIITSLFFNGCIAAKPDRTAVEAKRDYIVYNLGEIPPDLVMLNNENIRQQDLLTAAFEGLVKYSGVNEKTGKDSIVPGLAKSWTISKDETTYTFNIRENAYWSDGNKITAFDFEDFFYDILMPGQINFNDYELFCIEGAKGYREGLKGSNKPSVKAVNQGTFEIKLDYPCNFFLDILAEPVYSLRKIQGNLVSWKNDYKEIPCSGPFIIESLKENKEIVLTKNKNYWNSSGVKSSKIVMTSIAGSEECFVKFKNNDLDILLDPPESEIDELIRKDNILSLPSITGSYVAFNLKKENISSDVDLRKLIAVSVNKSDVYVASGKAKTAAAFAFKPSTGDIVLNKKVEEIPVDKISEGNLKFIFLDTKDNREICRNIADTVEKSAGIKFSLYPLDAENLADTLKKGNYDMCKIDIEGDPAYPLIFMQKLVSGSGFNNFGYSNPNYDKLIKQIHVEEKNTVKTQYLQEAKNILSKDVPLVPLYYYDTVVCKQDDITGIIVTKKGNIMLDKACMAKQ